MILFYNLITMKKYKLLKDLPFHKKWTIFLYDWEEVFEEWDIEHPIGTHYFDDYSFKTLIWEWFEEVKEEPKPKFKVWDYVVYKNWKRFIKIIDIKITSNSNYIKYNHDSGWWYYHEDELRLPTQEELEKYFR